MVRVRFVLILYFVFIVLFNVSTSVIFWVIAGGVPYASFPSFDKYVGAFFFIFPLPIVGASLIFAGLKLSGFVKYLILFVAFLFTLIFFLVDLTIKYVGVYGGFAPW